MERKSDVQHTQTHLRRSVVLAVRGGMSQTQASRVYGVSVRAANKWVAMDRAGGLRALKLLRRGRRAGEGLLNRDQAVRIRRVIVDAVPDQLNLPFYLWTRSAVVSLIKGEYGIAVSLTTASRYLKSWGMSMQRPRRRRGEGINAAFTDCKYQAIVRQAKRDNAVIYWLDEFRLRGDRLVGASDMLPGPSFGRSQGQRADRIMISAMTNRGHLAFMVIHGKFTSARFIQFNRRLLKQAETNVALIVESCPVYRSSSVQRFFKANAARIRLVDLLSNSGELTGNSPPHAGSEYRTLKNLRPRERAAPTNGVRHRLRRQRPQSRVIHSRVRDKYVRYSASGRESS